MARIVEFCVEYPKRCIAFFILITIFWAYQATNLSIDSNLWNILPKEKNNIELSQEDSDSYLLLGVEALVGSELFTLEGLSVLNKIIEELVLLPEIKRDVSIFTLETIILGETGQLIPGPPLPGGIPPSDNDELELFIKRVTTDPFMENSILCDNGKLISTIFITEKSSKNNSEFIKSVEEIIKPLRDYYKVSYGGDLTLSARAEYFLLRDFSMLLIGALIVMLIIFFLSFRARRALALPVAVVLMGVIWSIGLMGLLGFKITVVSCVVPALVLTIGNSYTIHVLNEFFRNCSNNGVIDKLWISKAVRHINKTIIMACATTIVGFISLLFASQNVIKEFAISVSFGVFTVAILSMFFIPAIFSLLKRPTDIHSGKTKYGTIVITLGKIGYSVSKNSYIYVILGSMLILSSFFVVPRLKIGSDYFDYFPKEDPVINQTLNLFSKTGGILWFNLSVESDDENYFTSTSGLEMLSQIDDVLINSPYVYSVESLVSYYKKINQIRFGSYDVPSNKGLLLLINRQLTNIISGGNKIFENKNIVSEDKKTVTFFVRLYNKSDRKVVSETEFDKFLIPLDSSLEEIVPKKLNVKRWGAGYIANKATSLLLNDQKLTMTVSFILVFFIITLYFKSLFYGIVAIIPLVSAISTNYILMVILGIPLDMTTIMVSSVAIGVGIDDAIHFLIQYKRQLSKFPHNLSRALYNTFKVTGRPIVLTTTSIVAGMLVLNFANFVPIRYFGILVAFALTGALVGTLFFLPAILVTSNKILNFFAKRRKN